MPGPRWGVVVLVIVGVLLGLAVAGIPRPVHERPVSVNTATTTTTTTLPLSPAPTVAVTAPPTPSPTAGRRSTTQP